MTDLAIPDNTAAVAPAEPQMPTSALALWAAEARQAASIATSLVNTSFVPATLRGKPADLTAALLAGQELGLSPMATLRSIDVIQGTPALRAHAMRGLVQSHGHKVQLVESTPTRCVMRGRRRGDEDWQEVTWTIDRATLLGLTGKSEWKKQPQTMLVARATGEISRLIASDVLFAMPYAAEELDAAPYRVPAPADSDPVTVEEITAPVTVAEITAAPSAPEPPDTDEWAAVNWPEVTQPAGADQ